MNWQWMVFLIGSYVGGAYILRSMSKTVKPKDDFEHSGLAAAFLFSPLWVWFWVITTGIGKFFNGIGRWLSGD